MLESIFSRATILARFQLNPLNKYFSELVVLLRKEKYSKDTIQRYLKAVEAFGKWLIVENITLSSVNEDLVSLYINSLERRKLKSSKREVLPQNAVGLKHFLLLLQQLGVINQKSQTSHTTATQQLLTAYDQYLEHTQGNAIGTRKQYLYFARLFLQFAFPDDDLQWSKLCPETITKFIYQQTRNRCGSGNKKPSSALRIFLRYLVNRGLLTTGFEGACPTMRTWTHASLPEYLSHEEVLCIVNASIGDSAINRRNHAIVLLLARLGLRAQEVTHLKLDDINWHDSFVVIRADKTRRERLLPLPQDVGQVIINYLQLARPNTQCREIFLKHVAPYKPLQTSSSVSKIIKHLLNKTAIKRTSSGAHLLRHTVASQMVNQGASFKEVADILGHQSLQTTGIYAKLNLATLAQVALPWLGGN